MSFGIKSMLFGALTGAGVTVLGQQLGWWAFTLSWMGVLALGGILAGVLVRTLGFLYGRRRRRKQQAARQAAREEAR